MKLLFVLGVGRSGTTLLQSMLASHMSVVALPETGFLRRHVLSGSSHQEDWRSDQRLDRLSPDLRSAVWSSRPETPDSFYRSMVRQAAQTATDAAYVLDKDPRLIEYVPDLFAAFPDAQVLHIVRDPRDVLLSKGSASWSSHRPWWFNLAVGTMQINDVERGLSQSQRWRVQTIRYEDLLSQPEAILRRLTTALALDFDANMTAFAEAGQRLVSEDERTWKRHVGGPLLTDNTGKWRNGLSGLQIEVCDRVLQRAMRRYHYEPHAHRSPWRGFIAGIVALVVRSASILLRLPVFR